MEPTEEDLDEVKRFGAAQLRQAGFDEGRALGAEVWFAGNAPAGTLPNVDDLLRVRNVNVEGGAAGAVRRALGELIRDGLRRSEEPADKPRRPHCPRKSASG